MDYTIYFDFGPKSATLFIFFFNGILFSFLLLKEGVENSRSECKWLSFFIFLCSLYISPFMLGYAGWYSKQFYREILFFVPFQQLFLMGPVIYFYCKSLLNPNLEFTRRDFLHFIPATLYMGYTLIVFITDKLILDDFYFYEDGRDKDLAFWYQMSGLISMLIYLLMSLKVYNGYRIFVVQEVSFADKILYTWVKRFLIAFAIILVLRVLFFILNPEWDKFGSKYWYYLCFSVLFFYMALSGYTHSLQNLLSIHKNKFSPGQLASEPYLSSINKVVVASAADLEAWKNKILQLFEEEEVYKNPTLTLTDVALALNTNRSIISEVINKKFGMNFNDFINSKRIDAVIEKIRLGEHNATTFLGIAYDCGFNSKATFNRAFKKTTALTPKEYVIKQKFK